MAEAARAFLADVMRADGFVAPDGLSRALNVAKSELERVAQLTAPHANPTIQPMHQSIDEHADDAEVVGEGEEE